MREQSDSGLSASKVVLLGIVIAVFGLLFSLITMLVFVNVPVQAASVALSSAAWLLFGLAVAALISLRLSRQQPSAIAELAEAAQRVAEGDYTATVDIPYGTDAAELAQSFNLMTESLRDRTDSLTTKMLELSTLFEMSRSLGSTLEMSSLAESVVDPTLDIFDADAGYIALQGESEHELSVVAERPSGRRHADDEVEMADWVYREGRPLVSNADTGRHATPGGTIASTLIVPLSSTDGPMGVLAIVDSAGRRRYGGDDVRLLSTIANQAAIAAGNIQLFSTLQESYVDTVRSLAEAVDAKDSYTRGHSDRVAGYATELADQLGLAEEQRTALEMAAYLHDIGKIGIPEQILLKRGPLDDAERAEMNHHPLIGANIVSPVGFPWPITPIVRHHHERYDGGGYPAGLKGDEIPLLARILSIADSYEAITADRPYRRGLSRDEAVQELKRCAGSQFDPRLVEVFISLVDRLGEVGGGREEAGDVRAAALNASGEDLRSVFAAIVEGVLSGFSRLAGPRLAAKVELGLSAYLIGERLPVRVSVGQVRFTSPAPPAAQTELATLREALAYMNGEITSLSGAPLVSRLYAEVLGTLPDVVGDRAANVALLVEV